MATPLRPLARLALTTIAPLAIALGSFACSDPNGGRTLSGLADDRLGGDTPGDDTAGGDTAGGGSNGGSGGGTSGGGGGETTGGGGTTDGGTGSTTGGGGTGTTPTTKPGFTIASDKAAIDTELQMLTDLIVTVTPKDGFTGSITLATTGLPTGATAAFTPASVAITGTAPVTAKLRITTPSTVTPTTAPLAVKITGSGGTATGEAALTYNVKRQITIAIPQNVAQSTNPFGAGDIVINTGGAISGANPIKVVFVNKDSSKDHIIHSTNTTNGFFHGDNNKSIPLDGTDAVRNVSGTGRYPFYMHDGASTPAGAIKIN